MAMAPHVEILTHSALRRHNDIRSSTRIIQLCREVVAGVLELTRTRNLQLLEMLLDSASSLSLWLAAFGV